MRKALVTELNKLEAAFDAAPEEMTESAVARMSALQGMRRREELSKYDPNNFVEREVGEVTEQGVIERCPVCNETAAKRFSKVLNSTLFIHSMRVAPTIADLVRTGKAGTFTDSGARGRLSIGEFHMVSANGQPVIPRQTNSSNVNIDQGWQKFFNQHIDTKKLAQIVDPDLVAAPQTRKVKAKAAPVVQKPAQREVPEWRREAARKAWEKIRANRAQAAAAA